MKKGLSTQTLNVQNLAWDKHVKDGHSFFKKILSVDNDTGMSVFEIFYPAGYMTAWHTHPCAHGIYVLDGILRTHDGLYESGSYVWFPEGNLAVHGATEVMPVRVVFITNKKFDIQYCENPLKFNNQKNNHNTL